MGTGGLDPSPIENLKAIRFLINSGPEPLKNHKATKIVSEYDQDIPQSQTADNPMAPRGRAAQPSRDTKKTN